MRILAQLIIVGCMLGTLYGVLGFSITLMFRSTGILSFAHAGFALIGAYLYSGLSCPPKTGSNQLSACSPVLPPWQATVLATLATTVVALAVERLVIRPLRGADGATKSIATAAVLGLASGVVLQVFGPQPRFVPPNQALAPPGGFTVAGVVIDWQRALIFGVSVTLVAAIALVLRHSWFGLGVRMAGQRPEVARLMGVNPNAVSRFNWVLGGALSGLAGALIAPVTVVNIGTFSFLLVKAVAAALIGGLVSLPVTFAAGISIGVIETVTPRYWERPGTAAVGIAALVVITLVANRKRLALLAPTAEPRRQPRPGPVAAVLGAWLSGAGAVGRRVPKAVWVVAAAAVLSVPLRSEFYGAVGLSILFYALMALSLVLVAGTAGQPSLMQMSFAGIGAYSVGTALHHDLPFVAGLLIGVAVCFVAGWVVGRLALRFRGIEFAIVSLTLAAVVSDFVLTDERLRSVIQGPEFFGVDLLKPQRAFVVMLTFTVAAFAVVWSVRRSAWGRSLMSLREDPRILTHFGTGPSRMEGAAFALSSAIAGLAGATYSLIVSQFGPFQFVPLFSITILLAAVVGGLRSLWGPVIAGVIFGWGPTLVQNLSTNAANAYPQIISSFLALVVIVRAPDGLASLVAWGDAQRAQTARRPGFRGATVDLRQPSAGAPSRLERAERDAPRLRRPAPRPPGRGLARVAARPGWGGAPTDDLRDPVVTIR